MTKGAFTYFLRSLAVSSWTIPFTLGGPEIAQLCGRSSVRISRSSADRAGQVRPASGKRRIDERIGCDQSVLCGQDAGRQLVGVRQESVLAFTERVGINRPWLHDILSGRVAF